MPSRPGSVADQNPDGTSTELRIRIPSALNLLCGAAHNGFVVMQVERRKS
jgi:hypothetical protein